MAVVVSQDSASEYSASEYSASEHQGIAHRADRRSKNERTAASDQQADAQGLVDFVCECTRSDCERSIGVPLFVYRRMAEAGDQYLLQAGHHAFDPYRTIISVGLMRIEERA